MIIGHREDKNKHSSYRRRIKGGYPAIEKKPRGFEDPICKVRRWKGNIINSYQRVRYGFCFRDAWNIEEWFLRIMPYMLQTLRKELHGFPDEMVREISDMEMHENMDRGEACFRKWQETLSEMEHLFFEATEANCSRKNRYNAEIESIIEREERKGNSWWKHSVFNAPEYMDIVDRYKEEEKGLEIYREKCCKEGLVLFSKWLHCLWD